MPYGRFLNALPPAFFLAVHLIGFLLGAFFAYRPFEGTAGSWAGGSPVRPRRARYMTYHLDWTVFLFAHTISEVLDLVAFILVFVGATEAWWFDRQHETRQRCRRRGDACGCSY